MTRPGWFLACLVAALLACTRPARLVPLPVPPAAAESTAAAAEPAPDFARDVLPVLQAHCTPCHFEGGKMHARLPFDRPETIRLLGEKLFTRIKDPSEQQAIREFLAAQAASPPGSAPHS